MKNRISSGHSMESTTHRTFNEDYGVSLRLPAHIIVGRANNNYMGRLYWGPFILYWKLIHLPTKAFPSFWSWEIDRPNSTGRPLGALPEDCMQLGVVPVHL